MFDVIIVGAGPAGIFTAYQLLENGFSGKIAIFEEGKTLEKRSCPKNVTKKCVQCKPCCNITAGFAGAGAFSDGKLSLSREVGGDLPDLIGADHAQDLIDYTDKIYLKFGADEHVEGVEDIEKIKEIRRRAIVADLKLVDCPIRHLGTEKAHALYLKLQHYLTDNGVSLFSESLVTNLIIKDNVCKGVVVGDKEYYSDITVVATGRRGADWLDQMCRVHKIASESGNVDIGVRVDRKSVV